MAKFGILRAALCRGAPMRWAHAGNEVAPFIFVRTWWNR
jgi:hypothetical protein